MGPHFFCLEYEWVLIFLSGIDMGPYFLSLEYKWVLISVLGQIQQTFFVK